MSKLSQKELLEELDKAVGIKTVAYEKIKEMIKKGIPILWHHDRRQVLKKLPEITEEWAGKRALKILTLIKQAQDEDLEDPSLSLHYLGLSLDIVDSILVDLGLKINKVKKRRGGCPPDFIPGKED